MKKIYDTIARDSGFCFWVDEEWKPENETIDWSTSYEKELQEYSDRLVNNCADFIHMLVIQRVPASEYPERLKAYFSIT